MKLIGILSWFDESASWLSACVASMARAGVTHLVAVDGAYRLYPDGRPHSGGNQQEALTRTAYGAGMGYTLHTPREVWMGNEVEKRAFCFRLAEQIAEPMVDWYFIMDADQIITKAPRLLADLEATELNVAETRFLEYQDPHANPRTAEVAQRLNWPREHSFKVRNLFRAIPGLSIDGNHYTYVTPGAVMKLWGNTSGGDLLEEALDLGDSVHIEHRTHLRDVARKESQQAYYRVREEIGAERANCARCFRPATRQVPTDFEPHPDGMVAGWIEACDDCAEQIHDENERMIRSHGLDPAELNVDVTRPV